MAIKYSVLKNLIIKSCRNEKPGIKFIVNYDKLSKLVDEIGLCMVNVGTKSKDVSSNDIALLSEYFKGNKLSWFNSEREYTTLVFVLKDAIDEKCEELISEMNKTLIDDPDLDKVKNLSTIIAEYPCYFATIVSYKSNDPNRCDRASYEIKPRANTVMIKREDYKYNPDDMV